MQIKPTMNRIIALRSVLLGWLCIGVYSIGMNTLHKNEPTRVKTWALESQPLQRSAKTYWVRSSE
jgi:hypothetical protein